VGHNSTKVSAALAAHAEMVGADAVSATPPGYFKPNGETGLVESIRPIVEAAAATPFYYYHIPQLSGVEIDPMRFTDLAMDRLSTFSGIKYSGAATMHNLPLYRRLPPISSFSVVQTKDTCRLWPRDTKERLAVPTTTPLLSTTTSETRSKEENWRRPDCGRGGPWR